ncbi:Microtubule-associated protein TORTIFOLIA1 [Platanthera guangdongensis]|uniref:Microtubule-associated protein TORTIFOLIA1 n=1 Tax=Platanthera guangdongensis TaxID=2320717 RepID=A0ABR2N087_9ASPA
MARDLSLSSGRRGGTMMMGFEGSPGKSYPNYNGLQDYTSKYDRGGENKISYPERYLSSYDMASIAREREIRRYDQVGVGRRSLNRGEGSFRLGEGPSARSVWQESKDEATMEAIRVAGEDNGIS